MIKIKKIEINNEKLNINGWAGRLVSRGVLSMQAIAELCSQNNTVTLSDAQAVLEALYTEVLNALKNGYSVALGELGSLNLTIHSTSTLTAKDWSIDKHLKGVYVRYTPSVYLRNAVALGESRMKVSVVE